VNKGIIFTIDGLLALTFIGLMVLVFQFQVFENEISKYQTNKLIGDLLICSQELSIDDPNELEVYYKSLLDNKRGYIIINDTKIEINESNEQKTNIMSQRINYINISNNEIYIEIGVYY